MTRPDPLEGAWRTVRYTVDNVPTDIDGALLLVAGRWATVYFVPGLDGAWGSGESGAYEFDDRSLTFRHRLTIQGGGGRPLYITREAAHVETCSYTIADNTLTIQFPSGNTLVCERLPHSGLAGDRVADARQPT